MKLTPEQKSIVNVVANEAEKKLERFGINASVIITIGAPNKTPALMIETIEKALGYETGMYKVKSKKREVCELRYICMLLFIHYFPSLKLKQIAKLLYLHDHATVLNGLKQGNDLLESQDFSFTNNYKMATKAVEKWMQE
jgi:chromosomal replication initiation ATPase DnaA